MTTIVPWILATAFGAPAPNVGGPDAALAAWQHADEVPCATPVVEALRGVWSELSVAERAEITADLAPFRADLFTAPFPPPGAVEDSCFGQQLEHRIVTDHF